MAFAFEKRLVCREAWELRMRLFLVFATAVMVVALSGALGGCGGSGLAAYKQYHLGQAEPAIASAVEFMGGVNAWKRVSRVRADAVMTVYDDRGQAYVNSQRHDIDINGGKLTISAATTQESWRATYTRGGGFSLSDASALGRMTPGRLKDAMSVLSHRLAGPLNLLGGSEKPGAVTRLTIDGKDLVRVAAVAKRPRATAYYFDANAGGLEMVTAGSEQPGGDGTVTLYTYQMLPSGMVFPKTVRVVRTGQNVLVGQSAVMEVEYSNVRID